MRNLFSIAILLFLFGCKKEPEPTFAKLSFTINHTWAGAPFIFNTAEYITPANDTVIFKRINYLISDFQLQKPDGNWVAIPQAFGYINANGGLTSFTIDMVPPGHYMGLKFMIGLDSATNHSDPNLYPLGHPLNAVTNNLHWDWAQGYVFIALEGYYSLHSEKKLVSLHIAFEENKVPFEFDHTFNVSGNSTTAYLNFDVQEYFQNPWLYNIKEAGSFTHSTNDNGLANNLHNNIATTLTLVKVE